MQVTEKPGWTIQRTIPVTLLVALFLHSATIVWWARGQSAKDESLDDRVTTLEKQHSDDRVAERLAVIEYQLSEQRQSAVRTEAALQSLRDSLLRSSERAR